METRKTLSPLGTPLDDLQRGGTYLLRHRSGAFIDGEFVGFRSSRGQPLTLLFDKPPFIIAVPHHRVAWIRPYLEV